MTWAIFPDEKDTKAVIELLTTGSERVMAVVGGALLEEPLIVRSAKGFSRYRASLTTC
jgi:hypothetical protein